MSKRVSPRMRWASWMSLGMMVTRLAWMAHKFVSNTIEKKSQPYYFVHLGIKISFLLKCGRQFALPIILSFNLFHHHDLDGFIFAASSSSRYAYFHTVDDNSVTLHWNFFP